MRSEREFCLLQDGLQSSKQFIDLLIGADRDAEIIIDTRQLEIADKDLLFLELFKYFLGRHGFMRRKNKI